MRGITNGRAKQKGKKDLQAVFRALRFKDGLTETAIGDEFSYHYNKARDGFVGNYVVYEVIDSNPIQRADDAVLCRDFYAQIDVFSVRSFESKLLSETLTHLEEKLTEKGFEVTMEEEQFEPDTKLYHQILFVSKLYS
ncbi:MAG: hypothetical protein LBF68_04355 [Christensenellaceae bacterium]|jgi:hypothetical protein|nr:hypothetical protein [Christensenellaceae bacterium]